MTETRAGQPLIRGEGAKARLAALCHATHLAIVAYALLGWLVPDRDALFAYLVIMPLFIIQWRLNRDSCALNNLETWLTSRRWRNPENAAEGGFLIEALDRHAGIRLTATQMNALTYAMMALCWLLGLGHFTLLNG